jgi:hypothetical protein
MEEYPIAGVYLEGDDLVARGVKHMRSWVPVLCPPAAEDNDRTTLFAV